MPMTEDAKRTNPLPMKSLIGVPFMHFRRLLHANFPIVICIGLVILSLQSAFVMAQPAEPPGVAPNAATLPSTAEPFYPLPLKAYYQRSLASYTARDAWGSVPRGLQRFDG